MGTHSIKGQRNPVSNLPCGECVTKPCCRRGNHGSGFAASVDGVGIPYNEHGNCPHLLADSCAIQEKKPLGCALFDCSRDILFRLQHPEVNALLESKGL